MGATKPKSSTKNQKFHHSHCSVLVFYFGFAVNAKTSFYIQGSDLAEERKSAISVMLVGLDLSRCLPPFEIQRQCVDEQKVTENGYEVMRQLIALPDIDLDHPDSEGRTPLSHAAGKRSFEGTELLIATGKADLQTRDKDGWSTMTWLERQRKPPPADYDFEPESNFCGGDYFVD